MASDSDLKRVRFSVMEDDHEEHGGDTFDRCEENDRRLHTALKKPGRSSRGAGRAEEPSAGEGRWLTTAALCSSFLGLGMSIAVIGPTFEDLALNVHKNISNISYIFAGRSAGYIGGSLLGGTLLDYLDPYLLLGLSMLLTALGMCAIPLCRQVLLLTGFMACIGISMGVLDTGGNVLALNTWREQAGPHLQALHFSFAAGALVSPIIVQLLFGAPQNCNSEAKNVTAQEHNLVQEIKSWTDLRTMWAYVVIGLFVFLSALLFFWMYCCSAGSRDRVHSMSEKPQVAKYHTAIVILLFLFFFAYVGAEVAYGSFIFTFSKDFVGLDKAGAVGVNTLFWGSFAAFRGLSILLATYLSPGTLITLSLVSCCISSLLLSLFPLHRAVLWAGTGLYGASMAAVFPSGLSWVEQYTPVTGHTAAVLVVGAAMGEMVLPVLLGFLMGQVSGEPLLMYQALVCAIFCAILFPAMYRLAVASGPRVQGDKENEFCQALLQPEPEDVDVFEMDTSFSSPH
ncbi:sodium-dependent glucose transporter 1 [Eucyclogobius newberryi]|uniref:sodium-dependent glucose transporter 1 n=1 Tax=Eucyclogobius newberryi TaxID=166745 RepID=UPI003B5A7E88